MNQPMNRNGSGYVDVTAYQAMKNVLKGNRRMKKGEIWEVECGKRTDYALVIAEHGKYRSILKLNDCEYDNCVEINCFGIKYVDCGMISYAFEDKFIDFVRTLKDSELDVVMKKVDEGLGIESTVVEKEVVKEVPVEVVKEIPVEVAKEVQVGSGDVEEIARLKAEANIYKGMYEQLLQNMLKGGANG